MVLKDLVKEARTGVISFSDLQDSGIWSPSFHLDYQEFIKKYKELGKEKASELIIKNLKKMGEKTYNALKYTISSRGERFSIPDYSKALQIAKSKPSDYATIVLLLSLKKESELRKESLKAKLREIEKELEILDELE